MGFNIGRKEANEKNKKQAETQPQVDSNPCSTGPEASTLQANLFYFVVISCRLREIDFQKSMTADSSSSGGGGST